MKQVDNRLIKIMINITFERKERLEISVIQGFLFDHLILFDRTIEVASNLAPFKCLLHLFIYLVALLKCFYL